jgi:hypothetical protein
MSGGAEPVPVSPEPDLGGATWGARSGRASIREAMDAGDWKSSAVFLETYVHTANASRRVADRVNAIEFLEPHG